MVPRDIDRYSTTIYLCIPRDVVPGDAGAGVVTTVVVCGGLYLAFLYTVVPCNTVYLCSFIHLAFLRTVVLCNTVYLCIQFHLFGFSLHCGAV